MAVTPRNLVSVESIPTPEQVWALSALVPHDWAPGIITRTLFASDVVSSKTDSEQRRSLQGRPTHHVEATLRSIKPEFVLQLQSMLSRMGKAASLVPLFSDQSEFTALASTTFIPCDTRYRRFFVDARAVIINPYTKEFEVVQISSKTNTQLNLYTSLSRSYPSYCIVVPLIEASLFLASNGSIRTDSVVESSFEALELPGKWCMDPLVGANAIPSGFSSYSGYPILAIEPDYGKTGTFRLTRSGEYSDSGISQVATLYGSKSRMSRTIPMTLWRREDAWKIIELFHSRRGRTFPFWVPSPTSDYTLVSASGTSVVVKANGPEIDWLDRLHMSFFRKDGTVEVRKILAAIRNDDEDSITLDSALTGTSPIIRCGVAHLMRFSSDELEERWITDRVCEIELSVEETANEKTITIANLDETNSSPLPAPFDPFGGGGDAGFAAPMFHYPCPSPLERPLGRAADLRMPSTIEITIADEFSADSSFPITEGGGVSAELLAALPGTYRVEYQEQIDGVSWHWHHLRLVDPSAVLFFEHKGDLCSVVRHRWRASKSYQGASSIETINVDFIAEWNVGTNGAAGALFHIFAYSTEINSGYIDGDAFAARNDHEFQEDNPAILASLAGGASGAKWCHPQMLLAASIPTTMEAPCINKGVACSDTEILYGFESCTRSSNGVPWVGNDVNSAFGNVFFGSSPVYQPLTLGGDCPNSSLFEHVIIENKAGLGITALKPERSGWNESTGVLDVLGGSSISISACLPSQASETIGCCEGNTAAPFAGSRGSPSCWGPSDDGPDPCYPPDPETPDAKCCFPADSVATITVFQKCECNQSDFDEFGVYTGPFCPDNNPISQCGSKSGSYTLPVCDMVFDQAGDQSLRKIEWATHVPNPLYSNQSESDDFDTTDPLTWTGAQGTWNFNSGGTAVCSSPAGGLASSPYFACTDKTLINSKVSVKCLSTVEQGVSLRSNGSWPAYSALGSSSAGTLKIYKHRSDDTKTVIASLSGLSFSAPYTISLRAVGSSFEASINSDLNMTVSATDCENKISGFPGMFAESPATFDDFNVVDLSPPTIKVSAWYDNNGFGMYVPKLAMPYDQQAPNECGTDATINPDCGVSVFDCSKILRTPFPLEVSASSSDGWTSLPGEGKPWTGIGGPGCEHTCVGCSGKLPCSKHGDFLAATLRVDKNCIDKECPTDSINTCVGMDYWYGTCTEP